MEMAGGGSEVKHLASQVKSPNFCRRCLSCCVTSRLSASAVSLLMFCEDCLGDEGIQAYESTAGATNALKDVIIHLLTCLRLSQSLIFILFLFYSVE